MRSRAAQVSIDQKRPAAAPGQAGGQLAGDRSLALTIQALVIMTTCTGSEAVLWIRFVRTVSIDSTSKRFMSPLAAANALRPGRDTEGSATTRIPKPSIN